MRILILGLFALLASSCAGAAQADPVATQPEPTAVEIADISTCLKINPVGPVTTVLAACSAHEAALDGFHEGAALMEFAEYQPGNAGPIAAEIRRVASELTPASADRAEALEAIAREYDDIEIAWGLRAPGVESSRGGDAAYIEVVTRELWNNYFETFFEGPDAVADAAHIVERVFVRMRGFELD